MVNVRVISSDCKVWNRDQVIVEIGHAMSINEDITVDLISEGPCFTSLDLTQLISQMRSLYNYQKDISVKTCNLSQQTCDGFQFDIEPPMHFVTNTKNKLSENIQVKHITKKFGLFVGRANAPRLDLSSYIWKNHREDAVMTYHFDIEIDYHRNNIGLDDLVRWQNTKDLHDAVDLIKSSPLKFEEVKYPILMDQHCNISCLSNDFLIEIVCETYYTGKTFFPTEKIWRPIMSGSPFIVQGPKYFLHKLRDLGFKTFERWWDEGYGEDPAAWQITEIKKVLDYVASFDYDTIQQWYREMTPSLDHNRKRFLELNKEDLSSIYKDLSKYD